MSCGQKANQKEKNTEDTIQGTSESKKGLNKIDKKEIDQSKQENANIENYICYTSDTQKNKKIWISFNNSNKATKIRYKGQSESIPLEYIRNEYIEGGTQPTIIDYYNEIYNGKINGRYKLTKSGNWYYVSYKREKDDKEFNFAIDHNVNNFTSIPCF